MTESITHPTAHILTLKKPGHYSASDWRQLIDSAWGAGISTDLKLQTFDVFWNKVDQTWGGFPNLDVNWDSLRNAYRPLVAAGISQGRFAGIMCRLNRALSEWHVFADDELIDAEMGISSNESEYPNVPSYHYKPGIPVLNLGNATILRSSFGAGVTSLGDTLGLVYSVVPNHPLGIQPGDAVLGYDGIPWKQLIRELFEAELPALGGGALGSTPGAMAHGFAKCVGLNWGLFDTIDILKYPTNDTLHFPTALLNSLVAPYLITSEQLPVNGVPFPNVAGNKLVSWGVMSGTNIGYVYVWDWQGVPDGDTRTLFAQAIDNLVHTRDITGLVLDFRTNLGGWEHYANDGFRQLFNIDPTPNYGRAFRVSGSNHLDFALYPPWPPDLFTPTPKIFDHPIAVLTGPFCGSAGDYNAFRMRFHPMVRFFGKPTAGAYTDLDDNTHFRLNGFECRVDPACVYSNVNDEAYMIHKAFRVDEEVWLTRDGVAKGDDDVVRRAVDWINALSYSHDVQLSKDTLRTRGDSVLVTAQVENPAGHTLVISTIVTTAQGAQIDSLALMNDGLHGDGAPGDSVWGAFIKSPVSEGIYPIRVRTDDKTFGTYRSLPKAALLTVSLTDLADLGGGLPTQFNLAQNYPNPFNPTSIIAFDLPKAERVRLTVYDLLGREVSVLLDEAKNPGKHEVRFDGSRLASGVYFYRLQAGEFTKTMRLMILK